MRILLFSTLFALFSLFAGAQTGGVGILDEEHSLNGITFGTKVTAYPGDLAPLAGSSNHYVVQNNRYLHMEGIPVSEMTVETHRNKIYLITYRVSPEHAQSVLDFFFRKYGYPQFFFESGQEGTPFTPDMEVSTSTNYSWWAPKTGLMYWSQPDGSAHVQLFDEKRYKKKLSGNTNFFSRILSGS